LAVAVCVLVPSLVFLGRYAVDGIGVAPAGSDTPQHVWRSEVVAELGLDALPAFGGQAQALNTNADRPGLPLALAIVSAVGGDDARDLVYVLPAVAAAAIALATAALAGSIPGVPWWGMGLVGVVTGASVPVAFAANGYLDQLLVEPLLLAAAASALRAAGGGHGRALGALCLVSAWLVHWQFALLLTALLGIVAIACLPASLRDRRAGRPLRATPSARVAATAGGGAGLGAAALLLGTPGIPRVPSGLVREAVDRQLSDQVSLYRLPAIGVPAALGAASLVPPRSDPGRYRAAWFLIPWALAPAVAWLLHLAGRTLPVQRTLSFALAIPMLAGLGGVAAVRWLHGRLGRAASVAGALLVAAAVVFSVSSGWEVWRTRRPWSEDRRLAELHALGAYLADAGRPAVVVVDRRGGDENAPVDRHFGTVPVMRRLRAELPPRLALRTTVYLGDPDRLLSGRPTLRPGVPGYDEISRETWRAVRPLLGHDPVIVVLRSQYSGFEQKVRSHPDWRAAGWVAVVAGPSPPTSFDHPATPVPPSVPSLLARWAAMLAIISFAGVGWAGGLAGGSLSTRIALVPAAGLAMLIPVGLVAERLGVRVGGPGGVAVWIGVAFAGAVAAVTRIPTACD
jgi:hypothetical protein